MDGTRYARASGWAGDGGHRQPHVAEHVASARACVLQGGVPNVRGYAIYAMGERLKVLDNEPIIEEERLNAIK
jgi:hypothetical protein